jgi:hypothetical protein
LNINPNVTDCLYSTSCQARLEDCSRRH